MRHFLLLLATLAVTATAAATAPHLPLRSRAADNAAILGTIAADAPALASAETVPDDALAALGWRRLRHHGTFTGYIPRRAIGKNLEVAPGTLVRVSPDPRADLLTIVAADDSIEIVEPSEWASIRITKELPVFVKLSATPPPPAPAPVPEARSTPTPTPVPLAGVIFTAADAASATEGSSRILEGTLREVRTIPGFASRYRFELLDRNGRRFAFVELQDAVLSGTLTRYLNQTVTIYGRIGFDNNDLYVTARVVRLREAHTPMGR